MSNEDDWDDTKVDPNAFNSESIDLGDFIIEEENKKPFRRKGKKSPGRFGVKRYSLGKGRSNSGDNTQLNAIENALKEIDFRYGIDNEMEEGNPTVIFSYGDPKGTRETDIDVKFMTNMQDFRSTILSRYSMDFKKTKDALILDAINYVNTQIVKGKFIFEETFDGPNQRRKSVMFTMGDFFGIRDMEKADALEMIALTCTTTDQYGKFFAAIKNGESLVVAKRLIKRG